MTRATSGGAATGASAPGPRAGAVARPRAEASCFHCGLPVASPAVHRLQIRGRSRALCCAGCEAVASAIVAAGLDAYYDHRTAPANTARALVPPRIRELEIFDHPAVQQTFVRAEGQNLREAWLLLEGINCAACMWLNESRLAALPGVAAVEANYATHRLRVRWDEKRTRLSKILAAIRELGYAVHPFDSRRQQQVLERERRGMLRRLGVAGVLGMQVMILAVALYAGDAYGMDAGLRRFFERVSLLLSAPVLLYSARPFFTGAWGDLVRRRVSMDVPVSAGLLLAFAGSAWATLSGSGAVYYDSIVMFVFLLTGVRYLELGARRRAADAADVLTPIEPLVATRISADGTTTTLAAVELRAGDLVVVRPGDTVPADGVVTEGRSSVDRSILTGESVPVACALGSEVVGGSINVESPLTVRVTRTGADTVLADVQRLIDRAQVDKPAVATSAERMAAWFVAAVLVLAAAVALTWLHLDPQRWLQVTVAVLVVSCPCALSLATPTALTAAVARLREQGVLLTRARALETLARADIFVFDKTGTLTDARLDLVDTRPLGKDDARECLRLAAALGQRSEHPVARALLAAAGGAMAHATNVEAVPGAGLSGDVEGRRLHLGSLEYVLRCAGVGGGAGPGDDGDGRTRVWLAAPAELLCVFELADQPRAGAAELVTWLHGDGRGSVLLTGDNRAAAERVARRIGIEQVHAQLSPRDKLDHVRALQAEGHVVAMIGDGVNDAPGLAGAAVSVAIWQAVPVAAVNADVLMLRPPLDALAEAVTTARRTLRIIRQNLTWAVGYNLLAVPLAAAGWVAPSLAVAGMSLSSLVVVANARRLRAGRGD